MRAAGFLAAFCAIAESKLHSSTLTPPVLPLIVRNPYLSTWLGDARSEPWRKWPMFWTGEEIGFGIMAGVPYSSTVYPLLGRPQDSLASNGHGDGYNVSFPQYKGAKYDASTTNLTYHIPSPYKNADGDYAQVVLSFLSPITPQSTLRQAIPASYLTVYVEGSFDLDVYIDVNGQWVSGDRGSYIQWEYINQDTDLADGLKTWRVAREQEALFTEFRDRAEWGTLYFTAPKGVRHESGTSAHLRQHFARTGSLRNINDHVFRGVMDEEPVFAFSKSFQLGNGSTSYDGKVKDEVMFTLSHIQDPVVQFASARGLTQMRPLWKSWFNSHLSLVSYHYEDFGHANLLARNYSDQLAIDAYQSGSSNYMDIVALSARQVLGATSFSGTPEDPLIFLKEISSNGNCQTVDVIFPAFPFFAYTNPRWLAYLLEPLLEHQLSGQYPNKYSMHDLGTHFPNETGHPDGRDEYMPVEECGDMLIMGLALANSLRYGEGFEPQSPWSPLGSHAYTSSDDGDSVFPLTSLGIQSGIAYMDDSWGGGAKGTNEAKRWVEKSYSVWKQWTQYLIEFSLEPHNQLSTDDFAGWLALQTNLALKGIVGIKAMSKLAEIAGNARDAKHYRDIADEYIKKWERFAVSRDKSHAKLAYNWYGSWTTLYSLFADAVLCFHPSITGVDSRTAGFAVAPSRGFAGQEPLRSEGPTQDNQPTDFIPHYIYTNQSRWYHLVMQKYGLPLDSRHLYTKSDWEFEAAAVAERDVRAEILDKVARWINETSTDRALSDLYETENDGGFPGIYFMARPVVGGHFAFLALERACGGNHYHGNEHAFEA